MYDQKKKVTAEKKYEKNLFSMEEEETLIDFVKDNPCLYNPKEKLYKTTWLELNFGLKLENL